MDGGNVLRAMRKKFYRARNSWLYGFFTGKSDEIPLLENYRGDALAGFWQQQGNLLVNGEVHWGKIVQVNGQMFRPGSFSLPGEIILSLDPVFESHSGLLGPIAEKIHDLKHTEPSDPELAQVAANITNELHRALAEPIPHQLTDGRDVFRFSVLFHRPHLPFGRVHSHGYYPMIVARGCRFAMVLPRHYWPDEYVQLLQPTSLENKWEAAKRRKQPTMPPVILTDRAQEYLMSTMLREKMDPLSTYVRAGVTPGQVYQLTFATKKNPGDTEIDVHGLRVLVDPYTMQNFRGLEVDYHQRETVAGFVFTEFLCNSEYDEDDD